MAHSIFLSHTHSDKQFTRRLYDDLSKQNIEAWIDEAEIKPGESLISKIENGIDKMDYLGIILSKKSVESEWVLKELRTALTQEILVKKVKVIPLLIENCRIPGFLLDKLHIDFRDLTVEIYKEGLHLLVSTLKEVRYTALKTNRMIFYEEINKQPKDARAFDGEQEKEKFQHLAKALTDLQFNALHDLRKERDRCSPQCIGVVESLALEVIGGNEWETKYILDALIKFDFLSLSADPKERNHIDPGYDYTPMFFAFTNLMRFIGIGELSINGLFGSKYYLSSRDSPIPQEDIDRTQEKLRQMKKDLRN